MHELSGKSFLVTGGAGNIGSYVVEALIAAGAERIAVVDNFYNGHMENLRAAQASSGTELAVINASIADHTALRAIFRQWRPDYAFHLASMLTLDCKAEPLQAVDYNIVGTTNVIDCCIHQGVKRLVHSSSASVFGEPRYLPVDEQHPFDNKLLYGATKIANEALLTSAYHEYGLSWVGLRYYNVYSERQRRGHLYTQVIPKWAQEIVTSGTLTINDDGSQTMDLIHAEDIARANLLALQSDVDNELFNIGSGVETSVRQLADWIIEAFGVPVRIVYQHHDPNRVKRRVSSTEKAERLLGFKAKITAREGIRRCVEAFKTRDLSALVFDGV
jgi:UDP-glucose 4-epimerase